MYPYKVGFISNSGAWFVLGFKYDEYIFVVENEINEYLPFAITAGNPDCRHTCVSMNVGKFDAGVLVKLVNHVAEVLDVVLHERKRILHRLVNRLVNVVIVSWIPVSAGLQFIAIRVTTCPEGDAPDSITTIGRVKQSTKQ